MGINTEAEEIPLIYSEPVFSEPVVEYLEADPCIFLPEIEHFESPLLDAPEEIMNTPQFDPTY